MNITSLHVDSCDVYRTATTVNDVGTIVEGDWSKVHENIPCRLSQKVLRSAVVGDNNSSSQEYKLFTGLDADVKQNDVLIVRRKADGQKYKFRASKPFSYVVIPHKEIVLTEISANEVDL